VELERDVPTAGTRAAIVRLAGTIESEDGAPPLTDDAFAHLASPDVDHVVARTAGRVAGYAQRRDDTAEIAAEPAATAALLDAVARPGLLVWAHGRRSRLTPVLEQRGGVAARELHQLRRPLADLPADPPLAAGVTVRPFRPGTDEQAWLAVNAAAFAHHREQGRRTLAELRSLMSEPWFDPAGFLLAERAGELLGFHWTKVHTDGTGEVYVLGVAPAAQGLGLGKALLSRGLHHLARRGCAEVLLYVDGDNVGARQLYEAAGFRPVDLDVQWQLPAGGAAGT
jgi:mycothiol synthase